MMEAMAAGGVTTPATQDGAWITPKDHSWRRDASRRPRRRRRPGRAVRRRARRRLRRRGRPHLAGRRCTGSRRSCSDARMTLWDTARSPRAGPGGAAGDLLAAYEAAGEPLPADARRARPRSRVRPAGGLGGPADDLRRGAARARHGARGHRLRVGGRRRCGVQQRRGADRRRRPRGAHVQPHVRLRRSRRPEPTAMAADERPSPEEIVLYDKDPETKIATITFNRPEYLNAPTSAARLRYADLLRGATVDDDVKVVVIRGVGDDLGSGADLPDFMAGDGGGPARRASSRRPERHVSAARNRFGTARRWASGMPTSRQATARCRS